MPDPDFKLSFEFFPPSSTNANLRLWRCVERLAPLGPDFVSVTYGAGGSTRERTFAALQTIRDRARLPLAGHLTCVGASREETLGVARRYRELGVTSVVALRGDPPAGAARFEPHPDGFRSADELVAALATEGLDISVAAYPEVHPEAASAAADLDALRAKEAAGATRAITQFCFETETFLRFRDSVAAAGISLPIVPGILPVENFGKMCNFAARCQASVPSWMHDAFGNAKDEEETALLSTAIAAEQCDKLLGEGVEHLHFYTLNNPDLSFNICRALGRPATRFSLAAGAGAA